MRPVDEEAPAASLDLTGMVCPMTYVRTKLALDELAPGQVLEVLLSGEEPARNVPRSAHEEGHTVVALALKAEGVFRLLIRKG